jgi:uncharacterized membrane protein
MRVRFVLLAAIVITMSSVFSSAQIGYKVVPITSPFDPPGIVSHADVNNHRAIAAVDRKSGRPAMGFIWRAGGGTPILTLGGTCSYAGDINDHGHVAGYACLPGDVTRHATLYRNHRVIDLDTFGGVSSGAGPINNKDQVAGQFTTADGAIHSFFWDRRKWKDLGFLGGSETFVYGLSESGIVTGQSDISNDPDPVFGIPHFHSFAWSNGVLTDLGQIFGSDFSYSVGVDSSGRIAGGSDLAGDRGGHAFLWDRGTVTDLSPYGDSISSWSGDVNNQGDIVGSWGYSDNDPADGPPLNSLLCPCYAVVWHDGQPTFLDDLVDPQWHLILGLQINDTGDIIALGQQLNTGLYQRVLLKPIVGARNTQQGSSQTWLRVQPSTTPRGFHRERDGKIAVLP